MKKQAFWVVLILFLALVAASACAQGNLTEGVYVNTFTAEGRGEYYNFFHFYENGLFYASQYNGGQYTVGRYEIKDEPMEYNLGDDENPDMTTADKTLVLTKLDGSAYATIAYDTQRDQLGDVAVLYNLEFQHDLAPDPDKSLENGVAIQEFVMADDAYSMVALKHNGTYEDTVGMLLEGTWTQDGSVYTLTDGDSGSSYTMTLSEDGYTAEYVGLDGEAVALTLVREAEAKLTFTGTTDAAYGTMDVTLTCYEDSTAKLIVGYSGAEQSIDGTWSLADTYDSVTVSVNGQEYIAPINPDDHSFAFDITLGDGEKDVTVAMSSAVKVSTVYSFLGESNAAVHLDLYSDGACEVIYDGLGVVTAGTWSADTSAGPLPAWTVTLDSTFENQPVTVDTDYATKFFLTFKDASGQMEETLALSFADYQAANP